MRSMSEERENDWIETCSRRLRGHQLHDFVVETLECFYGPFPRSETAAPQELRHEGTVEDLIAEHSGTYETLVRGRWQLEVDEAQASMFLRRLAAVDELLSSLPGHGVDEIVGRILRLGLYVRAEQIMALGVWPAIRLRALADFYYTRAVLLVHGLTAPELGELRDLASRIEWTPVVTDGQREEGLWQSRFEGKTGWGPQHITALKIDMDRFRLRVVDLRNHEGCEDAFAETLEALGAVAGASGGFFLYSEPDIEPPSKQHDPVGMILSDGEVLSAPIFNRAALLAEGRSVSLRRVGLSDVKLRLGEREVDVTHAMTRSQCERGPDVLSIAVVGNLVCSTGYRLPVPLNGFVLAWPKELGEAPAMGATGEWIGPRFEGGALAEEGISGGPLLLSKGQMCIDYKAEGFWGSAPPLTFSQDETEDRNLLARLVLGTDAAGFLYMVAVDGRQVEHALGLSIAGCAAWMQGLGCESAATMDGGSSKRLMLHGQVLDRPTTEVKKGSSGKTRIRPVFSGIAILPR